MSDTDPRLRASLERLVPRRIEPVEWDDIARRMAANGNRERARSRWVRRGAAGLAVSVAVLAALFVVSPWKSGPSILEKASAAITAPAGQVIYESTRFPASGSFCLAPSPFPPRQSCTQPSVSRMRLWVQGGVGDRTFRAVTTVELPQAAVGGPLPIAPFGNGLNIVRQRRLVLEVGGILGPSRVKEVLFHQQGQNVLTRYTQAPTAVTSASFDPVALVREAFRTGNARMLGRTMIRGRPAERIAVKLRGVDGELEAATYVVYSNFEPAEIVFQNGAPGFPYGAPFGTLKGPVTLAFTAFRYLPATEHNLALTSIHAQNPTARIVCGREFGLPDC